MLNPDPSKYVIRVRKDKKTGERKFLLVDRQILRWRKYRKPKTIGGYRGEKPHGYAESAIKPLEASRNDELKADERKIDPGLSALLERSGYFGSRGND